ncbi:NEL-type E3 ubiquitin ligase domain-containing protein [Pseudomonas fontis]|uniref:RING-type E3 ubiquitin transferase n=1 Tax=Pseudomonas fontis TaxID=2942633 RepID=A0ABT5NUA9_9PSED|nr:NEL-type E3 ubiquitin ligase domain-containing protein [Pseudomonas fontis]MDD0973921.1 hypothetical protein [Pseudomonas fontis]MDD0991763.1 hypothetical protein [Pseudomonas fontis]
MPFSIPPAVPVPSNAVAIDHYLAEQAPAWLKGAALDRVVALRRCLQAHQQRQADVRRLMQAIQPLDAFAAPLLTQALQTQLNLSLDITQARWREVKLRVQPAPVRVLDVPTPVFETYHTESALLERALQNFTESQARANAHFHGTGIVLAGLGLSVAPERFAHFCRTLDLGGRYQRHLDEVFQTFRGRSGESVATLLAADKLHSFELQAHLGYLKGTLDEALYRMLLQVVEHEPGVALDGQPVRYATLQVLDCTVQGAVVFEVLGDWMPGVIRGSYQRPVNQLVVYLPSDAQQPFRQFRSWRALGMDLGQRLKSAPYRSALLALLALDERPGFMAALLPLLHKQPLVLGVSVQPLIGVLFEQLAQAQLARIKADAAALAVPTAGVDLAVYRARVQAMASLGLTLLGVAVSFIPGVGEVMLASMVLDLLGEVYEGVEDWSHGERDAALTHLLGVVENLVAAVVVAAGGLAVMRSLRRSPFVDGLIPVVRDDGATRLWSTDLTHYQVAEPPPVRVPAADGLLHDGAQRWLARGEAHYAVEHQVNTGCWRIQHPRRAHAYAPRLEHNDEAAWLLPGEHPLRLQGVDTLLQRLAPQAQRLTRSQREQVARIADVDEAQLRGLLVEHRPMPVGLRDTLEHYTGTDTQPLPLDDPDAALVQRDYPGLPARYVEALLNRLNAEQREYMSTHGRVPLAVAEQARELLREARVIRTLLGLGLRDVFNVDSVRLCFALLRRLRDWPAGLGLELREGSAFGRLLERQLAQAETRETRIFVHGVDGFMVYDANGYALDDELPGPAGFFEALVACLSPAQRNALGWSGADLPAQLRESLLETALGQRAHCATLLGMTPARPRLNRVQRLPDGRLGYPLSGRGAGTAQTITERVRALFPTFSDLQVESFLGHLQVTEGNVMTGLSNYEQSLTALNTTLANWQHSVSGLARSRRRTVANALRRCWRCQVDSVQSTSGTVLGYRLQLSDAHVSDLPIFPEDVTFTHVLDLDLARTGVSMADNGFLRAFSRIRWLDLSRCRLTDIPPAIGNMSGLTELILNRNQIHLSEEGATRLASLSQLMHLDLERNPIGTLPDLRNMPRLRELRLRNAGLEQIPAGVLEHPLLMLTDLRENNLVELSDAYFEAPRQVRDGIMLQDNPLSLGTRVRILSLDPHTPAHDHVAPSEGRRLWLETAPTTELDGRVAAWDRLEAEQPATDFLRLLSDLTETAEFRGARKQLTARVWQMLDAMHENTVLRDELFDLAASPTTCVDSVSSTFSMLEVRFLLFQARTKATAGTEGAALLKFARQLFRLEQVERLARVEIVRRQALGRTVDEIEVSLAYRTGLVRELDLPGQPSLMQFSSVAAVSAQALQSAAQAVRAAETVEQLAASISSRDFWIAHLRAEYASVFDAQEQEFWEKLDRLSGQQGSLPEGEYLQQMNSLGAERETALGALALALTEDALRAAANAGVVSS